MRQELLSGVASYEVELEIDVGHSSAIDQEFVTEKKKMKRQIAMRKENILKLDF
jgi:hypothetical protein